MPDLHHIFQTPFTRLRQGKFPAIGSGHLHRSPIPAGIDGRIHREISGRSDRTSDQNNVLPQCNRTFTGGNSIRFQSEHDGTVMAVGHSADLTGAIVIIFIRRTQAGSILQRGQARQTSPVPQRHDLQILIPLPQQLEHAPR